MAETRRRLADAGYRPELIDGAIARLLAIGLLDDELFARGWIESRDRARPRGEMALRRELGLRGVDVPVIAAVSTRAPPGGPDNPLGAALDADDAARPAVGSGRSGRRLGCSSAGGGTSSGSRTRASGAPAPTHCSPGMASGPEIASRIGRFMADHGRPARE